MHILLPITLKKAHIPKSNRGSETRQPLTNSPRRTQFNSNNYNESVTMTRTRAPEANKASVFILKINQI